MHAVATGTYRKLIGRARLAVAKRMCARLESLFSLLVAATTRVRHTVSTEPGATVRNGADLVRFMAVGTRDGHYQARIWWSEQRVCVAFSGALQVEYERPERVGHGHLLLIVAMAAGDDLTGRVHGRAWVGARQDVVGTMAFGTGGSRAGLAPWKRQVWRVVE